MGDTTNQGTAGTESGAGTANDTQQGAKGGQQQAGAQQQGDDFQAITSQDELNRIIDQRLGRERAKFGDYEDLKAKAAQLDQIEEANKTELQRATDSRTAAEKRAEKAEYELLRERVARTKGVPPSSISGATKEELEASAAELLAWRGDTEKQQEQKRKASPTGGDGFKSGATGNGTAKDPKERAAEALRLMRNR